ncbi:MAG: response regulator transcription factor [Acidimicrobiales bacterium]|jgi:DNA-binding response OmpR family regulator|nr:response regulator transcription factor [Acidimicrobiales bacterium]
MRVLVVEDDAGVALGVRRALEAEGLAVDVAADGLDGWSAALSGSYDLVVLDIMVPRMNGYRVCAALRAEGIWTPILMLTAKTGEYDIAEGLETGADDYLTKPFSMIVLVARVKALLRRPRSEGGAPFTFGALRVDPSTHRCWFGEAEVELTAREMDVLTFLMSRGGTTVSKAQVIDNVWGEDFTGDPNIVEVYVGRLRRKLQGGGRDDPIETVRGIGYRMRP